MASPAQLLTFTDIELRSYLPSGWGIHSGAVGRWDAAKRAWKIDVCDSADNLWPLVVTGKNAEARGRLQALRQSVDRLYRNALA